MTAPLAFHLGSQIPDATDDPLLQAWQVAWDGHALLHQPLHLFDANAFWPERHSLAFSDSLLGYGPAGMIGSGPLAALYRYNGLFVFAYVLAFVAGWFLARELGLKPLGAAVAATAFAFAPWRAAQAAHLHVLSSGGIPLTFFFLLRGFRRRSPWHVFAGFAVAAWQVSLGFSLGLQLLYALLVVVPLLVWRNRDRRLVAATGGGAALLAAVSIALAIPYLQVRDDHPESKRSATLVKAFSPPARGLLAAPAENVVWGYRTSAARNNLQTSNVTAPSSEKTLFPGLVAVLLALVGLRAGPFPRALRIGLAIATAFSGLLALGLSLGSISPYKLFYDLAPGWDAIRTPGRLATLMTLGLALLAGAGADRLRAQSSGRVAMLTLLLPVLVLFEGWAPPEMAVVPKTPAYFSQVPTPALYLPSNRFVDSRYMYWSTDGFGPIVNGWSGFEPKTLVTIRDSTRDFLDAPDGRVFLRGLGVKSVVAHGRVYRP
ncbi:MAG: hypothetical protein QOJ29_4765 [Thermoleophilaceae bacterium]|nr:hypothetical protein [Thermoleophilaceae bacterium]